jgi:hypothetical protein
VALKLIPDMSLKTTICWLLAQATATCINFLVLRTVVFRLPPPEPEPVPNA